MAVWSGDTVRMDTEGFLYFVGRADEMIKTSGYRVSPSEIEEVACATGLISEAAAFGVAHPALGQAIALIGTALPGGDPDSAQLQAALRQRLPSYMVPSWVEIRRHPLPRNPNGKLDRKFLSAELAHLLKERAS